MYGLESDLEAVLKTHPELFTRGMGWQFLSAQRQLAGSRADLIFRTCHGRYAVVEVKRGQASDPSVNQALRYAVQLRAEHATVQPWVVAHVITEEVRCRANELDVKVLQLKPEDVAHLLAPRTPRKEARRGVPVANDTALAELPSAVASALRAAAARPHFKLDSWSNRTYVQYRGEDLLGVVRRGQPHIFVMPSGSRLLETEAGLVAAGFTPKPKPGEHAHPWYHARFDDAAALRRAIPAPQPVGSGGLTTIHFGCDKAARSWSHG